ncbi:LOB domain-containing protein CRL1-like [Ipomoea triloba]|uniref:LOB domain-containing protein CRL1-like n=1 Tax=Ipomoea triloba TaxID=35885 RepID=UPI00125CF0AF|nr:LOB domain-containing protein CRL1-like [Ipomoea triloba]XP_031121124.1 LOB domain-containing protein CRL1-like [Ipomoea triloba]
MVSSGAGSPCGACKFLRRRCVPGCVFVPYFCSDDGPAIFAAIHKVFGASNVSKLLLQLPVQQRFPAVFSIGIEAQARMEDPIYGCVSHIIALQQQVLNLRAQVMEARALQAQYLLNSMNAPTMVGGQAPFPAADLNATNPSTVDGGFWALEMEAVRFPAEESSMQRASPSDVDELQALALRMTKPEPRF